MRSWRSGFRLLVIVAAALVWATPQVYASDFLTAGTLVTLGNESFTCSTCNRRCGGDSYILVQEYTKIVVGILSHIYSPAPVSEF